MRPAANIVSIEAARRRALCDEFGELDRKVREFSLTKNRHEEVRKQIQAFATDLQPQETATYEGSVYRIHLAEQSEERTFSTSAKKHIWKTLKAAKAWKLFNITLKAVTQELGDEAVEELATKERTGSRKVTAVAIMPAEAA